MKDAFGFLKQLKTETPPPVVHLRGEDALIRETIRRRIVMAWSTGEEEATLEFLIGSPGIAALGAAAGGGSFFSLRKVLVLTDPPASNRKNQKVPLLSTLGKNQLAELARILRDLPKEHTRVLVETGDLKPTSQLLKTLAECSVQVDASPPKGKVREQWIQALAKRAEVALGADLLEAMTASDAPLSVLAADLEKVALATEEGKEADLDTWQALTQAEPQAKIWETGDALGEGNPGKALAAMKTLEESGTDIYGIVPALLSWNQQRLQVKSAEAKGRGTPEGMAPFIIRKIKPQVAGRSLPRLRREQKALFHLDRALKQSWEDPQTLLEKFLVEFSRGKGG
ncbi:MAG: hypothetical protein HUU16_00915 [Candidatus Omnitrophica bacterium]|nr:hypothetical protein [bacterium]NUN94708.1 hypothetical protein [Candidatus Omnitrophota bacterium]